MTVDGAAGPGKLALLILDAEALGANPRQLRRQRPGDPAARHPAVERAPTPASSEPRHSSATYLAGTYDQGLALAALAAAGVHGTAQVGVGGELAGGRAVPRRRVDHSPTSAVNTCTGTPGTFPNTGPDTNSTALAVDGLVAQGALRSFVSTGVLGFFAAAQDADAGWSYYPNSATTPQTTQPTSTALVIQALLALGLSPTAPSLAKGTADAGLDVALASS